MCHYIIDIQALTCYVCSPQFTKAYVLILHLHHHSTTAPQQERRAMQGIIGKRLLAKIKPKTKPYDIRDTRLTGFFLRVQPSGRMSYYCEYARGKKFYIGKAEVIKPDDARETARQTLADYSKGVDPNETKNASANQDLSSFLDNEYGPWVKAHRKSGEATVNRLNACFKIPLGEKRLDEINPLAIDTWRTNRLEKGIRAATINRDLAALKAALAKAVEWEQLELHPIEKLKRMKVDSSPKVRYLSANEEKRLREALDAREEELRVKRDSHNYWRAKRKYKLLPDLRTLYFADKMKPMVLLSINTGLRRGETFNLKWEDIDIPQATLTVIGSVAKSEETRHIPLNKEALSTLINWKKQSEKLRQALVFPGKGGEPLDNIKTAWKAILSRAKIIKCRWHDLRHHFASQLVMKGVDLNTVRELLGHADIKSTLRYAHLAPHVKAEAVSRLLD
jgi:integrase